MVLGGMEMRKLNLTPVDESCSRVTLHGTGTAGRNDAIWCKRHLAFMVKCVVCGKEFHTARFHTRTCGDVCRKRLSRQLSVSQIKTPLLAGQKKG